MIVSIDPGATHTGVVIMDRGEVWDAHTISIPHPVGTDNAAMVERVNAITWRIDERIDTYRGYLEAIVIEGWAYLGGRNNAASYQTPWLIGALIEHLSNRYAKTPIFVQLSTQVLNPRTPGNCAWVKQQTQRGAEIVNGAGNCKNDHTRSALAHAIYFYQSEESEGLS